MDNCEECGIKFDEDDKEIILDPEDPVHKIERHHEFESLCCNCGYNMYKRLDE